MEHIVGVFCGEHIWDYMRIYSEESEWVKVRNRESWRTIFHRAELICVKSSGCFFYLKKSKGTSIAGAKWEG